MGNFGEIGEAEMPWDVLTMRLCPGHAGVLASLEDRTGLAHGGLWSFKFVKKLDNLLLRGGVHKMHESLLEKNNILPIILMHKVSSMFRSDEHWVFYWIPNLTAPQNYLHGFWGLCPSTESESVSLGPENLCFQVVPQ